MSDSHLLPVYPRLDIELVRAAGCWLETSDGRRILDMYGAHAVCPLGHGHSALREALSVGWDQLDFYSNSLHMPAQEAAARAVLGDSQHLGWVHFVNSGTEANEAALHLARRITERRRVISFDCGFHGRTLGSLSVTGLSNYQRLQRLPADAAVHDTIRYGEPDDLGKLDRDTAAVICESVPSLAGVLMPPAGYYAQLAQRCRQVGALLIFDEVQGGVGRLGRWFAHELFGVEPDLVTLAKGIAAGYPAGALVTSEVIGGQVRHGELGTTFGGGPVACRMISAVAGAIREGGLMRRVERVFALVREGLTGLGGVTVRGAGCLIGVQTELKNGDLRARLLERDILVGVSCEPHTIRLMPPYTISDGQLERFIEALGEVIGE